MCLKFRKKQYFKSFFSFVLTLILMTVPLQNAKSWDVLKRDGEFNGVRTNFNPAFGAFEVFPQADNSQRTRDIIDYGFFGLVVECDTGEKTALLQYSLWNNETKDWEAQALAPIQRVNVKFGNAKPISWNVSKSEWWPEGPKTAYVALVFSNPTFFMKKISSANSVSLTVEANKQAYQLKFITSNFKKYLSYFKKSGCN